MRPVMNEARPAVQLAWPYQLVKTAPSLADAVDVRGRMAERRAAAGIGTEIVPAGVVGHQHDDVRLLAWSLVGQSRTRQSTEGAGLTTNPARKKSSRQYGGRRSRMS